MGSMKTEAGTNIWMKRHAQKGFHVWTETLSFCVFYNASDSKSYQVHVEAENLPMILLRQVLCARYTISLPAAKHRQSIIP